MVKLLQHTNDGKPLYTSVLLFSILISMHSFLEKRSWFSFVFCCLLAIFAIGSYLNWPYRCLTPSTTRLKNSIKYGSQIFSSTEQQMMHLFRLDAVCHLPIAERRWWTLSMWIWSLFDSFSLKTDQGSTQQIISGKQKWCPILLAYTFSALENKIEV